MTKYEKGRKKAIIRERTKAGLVHKIYGQQRSRSKTANRIMPTYTLQELKQWFREQPNANQLYDAWKASGYDKWLKPSVDRKDDDKGYSMDNIQLMTWRENLDKSHSDRKSGRNNKANKAVVQMDMDGEFIAEYHSQSEAGRVVGLLQGSIRQCCIGKSKSAGGFKWKHRLNLNINY